MKCKHLVERNGYYTGRKCSREATHLVTMSAETEDVRPMCTQHTNAEVARSAHWPEPITATPIEEGTQ